MTVDRTQGNLAPYSSTEGNQRTKSAAVGLAARIAAPAATARPNDGGTFAVDRPQALISGGGGEAADRLEKRTHLNQTQPRYRVALRDYGNGIGEIGWSFIPTLPPKKSAKGKSESRQGNEDRAVRRARSRLRHLILSARADHLLTLTYRENITNFAQASSDLARFVRLVKAKHPGWVYIAVGEQQKRGAWHWHMAVKGRQEVDFLRGVWRSVVVEGNIDVNPPKGQAKNRQLALVKYLGKYLAKSFSDGQRELNARRFRASLGIEVPLQYLTVPETETGNVAGYALNRLMTASGSVGFVWQADDKTAGWACSWK